MIARYVFSGEMIDYTPAADVAAGSVVVIGNIIGITKLDIKAGTLGSLALVGVYEIVKATGDGTAVTKGQKIYWDATNQKATPVATGNVYLGDAIAATEATGTKVMVRLGGISLPDADDAIASLTDNSGGTAAATIAAVTDVATAANAIAGNTAKINAILAALRAYGVIAAS